MGKTRQLKKFKARPRAGKTLWIAGAAALLVAGWSIWESLSRGGSDRFPGGDPSLPGGYARRETRTTLSPALFVGKTAAAYQVAQEIPAILDQLYCYCECDKHVGHASLLSCFIDSHAAT